MNFHRCRVSSYAENFWLANVYKVDFALVAQLGEILHDGVTDGAFDVAGAYDGYALRVENLVKVQSDHFRGNLLRLWSVQWGRLKRYVAEFNLFLNLMSSSKFDATILTIAHFEDSDSFRSQFFLSVEPAASYPWSVVFRTERVTVYLFIVCTVHTKLVLGLVRLNSSASGLELRARHRRSMAKR